MQAYFGVSMALVWLWVATVAALARSQLCRLVDSRLGAGLSGDVVHALLLSACKNVAVGVEPSDFTRTLQCLLAIFQVRAF